MKIFILIIILLFCAAYFFMAASFWEITPDSYVYFTAGKNLLETGDYAARGAPVTVVPFGFPAILSSVFYFFGSSFLTVNIFMKILAALCLIPGYIILRQNGAPAILSLMCILLTASSIHLMSVSMLILADIPFAFFSLISICLINLYIKHKDRIMLMLGAGFILFSYFIKTIGIALMCALIVYFILELLKSTNEQQKQNKRIIFAVFLCFFIPAALWEMRNILLHGRAFHYYRSFLEKVPWIPEYASLPEIVSRTIMNFVPFKLWPMGSVFANAWLPRQINILSVIFIALSITVYLGVFVGLIKNKSFLGIYVFFYLCIYSIMNMYGGGTRYLIPILPFMFFYSFYFIKESFASLKVNINKSIFFYALIILYLIPYGNNAILYIKRQFDENRRAASAGKIINYRRNTDEQEISDWLKANTPKPTVCLAERAEIDELISGRKFFGFPYTADQNKIVEFIQAKGIEYIILDKNSPRVIRFLLPVVVNNKRMFEAVINRNNAALYKVNRFKR